MNTMDEMDEMDTMEERRREEPPPPGLTEQREGERNLSR